MNVPEAVKLYTAMVLLDPYAKQRTEQEIVVIAEQIAQTLPTTPLDWALKFVQQSVREGKVPSIPEIAAAWTPEARRRVESVPVPPAPEEIETDPERWRAWEKARRAALVQGANPTQAVTYANRAVGAAAPARQITSADPVAGAQAKEYVLERVRAWARQQSDEQDAMFSDDTETHEEGN